MAKKRESHYSKESKERILVTAGLDAGKSKSLSNMLDEYTFYQLDALYDALKLIKKGD